MLLQIYLIIIPLQAELVGHLGYLCLHFFLLLEKRKILLIVSPLPNSWEKGTYNRR